MLLLFGFNIAFNIFSVISRRLNAHFNNALVVAVSDLILCVCCFQFNQLPSYSSKFKVASKLATNPKLE